MKQVKIKLDGGIMPRKATEGAAAYDLYVPEDVVLTGGRQVINLKFSMEIPQGYAATIQPRSGFSAKGIEIMTRLLVNEELVPNRINGDVIRGLIDSDYRGNVGVIVNVSANTIMDNMLLKNGRLKKGTRIAQMQIIEVPQVELVEVQELSETDRGEGGFGSTGTR